MKLNFGVKIVIFYILFISLILTLVIKCYNNKVDLVTSDYYAKELIFQNKLDALNRDVEANHSFNYSFNSNEIVFELDSILSNKKVEGTLTFYRPSNADLDVVKPLNFENGKQTVSLSEFKKGFYKVQFDYKVDNVQYFKEYSLKFN
jgi:hypothetical protein